MTSSYRELKFICHICGGGCLVEQDPPETAVCADCCEHDEYVYDYMEKSWYCSRCGAEDLGEAGES